MLDASPPDPGRREAARASLAAAILLALLAAGPAVRSAWADGDAPPSDTASSPAPPAEKEKPAGAVTEDVVVSATRVERSAEDVPLSVTVVGPEKIERLPVRTTDDLVRTIPGINMPPGTSTYYFPSTQTLSMRGAGARRALVLQDGIPATDPFSGSVEWIKIPVARLERVEVVRGGGASVFGSQALGGLVNFVTRRADTNGLEAEAATGSYATHSGSFAASRLVGGGVGVAADGSWFQTDGFQHEAARDRGAVDIPMAARNSSGRIRADWSEGEAAAGITASASTEDLSLGTPLSNVERQIQDLAAHTQLTGVAGGKLSASGYFQHEHVAYDNTAFFAGQGRNAEFRANHHDEPIQALGGSLLWSRESSGALPLIAAGVDVQSIRGDDRADNFSPEGAVTQRLVAGGNQTFAGVFVEASLAPSPVWELLGSVRYDSWRNFDGHQIAIPGGGGASIASRSDDQIDPRLAARVTVAPGIALRAAGYRSFRAPTLRELYYQTLAKTQQTLSNPDLGPEHAWGGEAGADAALGDWKLSATAFTSRIEGIIGTVQISGGPPRVLESFNVGVARAEGVEASAEWAPAQGWSVEASWAYTESKLVSSDIARSLVGKWTPGVPRNAGALAAIWSDAAGRSAALRARSYSRQYADATNALALDAAVLVDLSLEHPLWSGASVAVSCNNLFDRRYVVDRTSGYRLGDRRLFLVALRWRLGSRAPRPAA